MILLTFQTSQLMKAFPTWIFAGLHTRGSARLVVPLTLPLGIVVVTEESYRKRQEKSLGLLALLSFSFAG